MIKYTLIYRTVFLALISFRVLFSVFFSCFVFLCSVFLVFLIWAKLPEMTKWMDGWITRLCILMGKVSWFHFSWPTL